MATVNRVRITTRTVVIVLALLVALKLISQIPDLLVDFFLAIVIASAMLPAVRFLRWRSHWPRPAAVMGVFFGTLFAISLIGALIVPPFFAQATQLAQELPHTAQSLSNSYDWIRGHGNLWRFLPPPSRLLSVASTEASRLVGQGLGWAQRALGAVTRLAMILVVAFFVLLDGPRLRDGFSQLIPPTHRALITAQIEPVALKLGLYVQGTLMSIGFFILFQAIVLSLIHLPLALGVAVIAGVLDIIPMLGSLVGLAIGVLLASTVSYKLALLVVVSMMVGRVIQDNLVNPYVFSKSLELPPSLTVIALLIGAGLLGLEGALIAMPLLATIQVLVQNLYLTPLNQRMVGDAAGDLISEVPLRRPRTAHVTFWPTEPERTLPPE